MHEPTCSRIKKPSPSLSNKSFTLIELLVVVVVIAILASLLLPALAKAKFRARIVTCMSNLKQVALGQVYYTDDYDGWYVTSGILRKASWERPDHYKALSEYVGGQADDKNGVKAKGNPLFRCPQGMINRSITEFYSLCPDNMRLVSQRVKENTNLATNPEKAMRKAGQSWNIAIYKWHNTPAPPTDEEYSVVAADVSNANYGGETNHIWGDMAKGSDLGGYGLLKTAGLANATYYSNYTFDDGSAQTFVWRWSDVKVYKLYMIAAFGYADWDKSLYPKEFAN